MIPPKRVQSGGVNFFGLDILAPPPGFVDYGLDADLAQVRDGLLECGMFADNRIHKNGSTVPRPCLELVPVLVRRFRH